MTQEGVNSGGGVSDIFACCEDNFWSLLEGELQTLAEVSGKPIAQAVRAPSVSVGVTLAAVLADVVGEKKKVRELWVQHHESLISCWYCRFLWVSGQTFCKNSVCNKWARRNWLWNVPVWKKRMFNGGERIMISTSTGGLTNEIWVSEMNAMTRNKNSVAGNSVTLYVGTILSFDVPLIEWFVDNENFFPTKQILPEAVCENNVENFFEMIPSMFRIQDTQSFILAPSEWFSLIEQLVLMLHSRRTA